MVKFLDVFGRWLKYELNKPRSNDESDRGSLAKFDLPDGQEALIRLFGPTIVIETLPLFNAFFGNIDSGAIDFVVFPFQMNRIHRHREQLIANSQKSPEGNRCIFDASIGTDHQILNLSLFLIIGGVDALADQFTGLPRMSFYISNAVWTSTVDVAATAINIKVAVSALHMATDLLAICDMAFFLSNM